MSCHVTCHVTAVSHASSSSKIKKENKINIKSETLNKRKEKLLVSKVFHNTLVISIRYPPKRFTLVLLFGLYTKWLLQQIL